MARFIRYIIYALVTVIIVSEFLFLIIGAFNGGIWPWIAAFGIVIFILVFCTMWIIDEIKQLREKISSDRDDKI